MKTTIEIPDSLFRRAKAEAASGGITLKQFFMEALAQRLGKVGERGTTRWMTLAGELHDLSSETRRIEKSIEAEFERVDEDQH